MFETYIPGFSNTLTFQPELTGGGPAYTTITPDFMPEPAEGPAPAAMTPQEEFQARVRQIEAMVPGAQAAQPPSIRPSPSAPPMMSAPNTYVPGFTPMLMRPDLLEGGPAYADMAPGAMPERVSMLPFAPEAFAAVPNAQSSAAPQSSVSPQLSELFPGGLDQKTLAAMLSTAPGAVSPAISYPGPGAGLVTTPDGEGFYFYTDKGRLAGYGGRGGFIAADPNAQYRLWDERGTNKIVSSGTGVDALQNIYNLANQFNKEQGNKANWGIERLNPATGQWERISENDPSKNIVGKVADFALPLAGALLVPGIGLVGSKVLAAGLGAAAGSGLSSVAQGRSLGDTLLRAGLSGAGAAGGAALGKVAGTALSKGATQVGGTVGDVATQAATQKLAQTGAQAIPEILITGSKAALTGATLGGALGGGASGALSSMAPGKGADFADRVFKQPTTPAVQVPSPLDTVAGAPIVVTNTSGGVLPIATAGAGALAQPGVDAAINSIKQQIEQKQAEQEPENQIVVRPTDTFDEAFAPFVPPNVGTLNVPEDEIVVTASGKAPTSFDKQPAAPLAPTLPDLTKTPVDAQGPEKNLIDQLKDRIKGLDAVDYLRLAGVLLPLLDGGGGGSRASRTLPSGMFGGSSIFSGGLPRATLPGASTGFAPRTAADLRPKTTQDWYRYGYGPEQSFFSYVPEGERNLSQAYTGYAHGGMAEGGERFAVNGPGTGRSDEIPAMLSDGEYVIDAETVALLGDGSSKAGAERLDQFRINVRKHKGRHLAKGDFSVNAKRPEKYLKGGRA